MHCVLQQLGYLTISYFLGINVDCSLKMNNYGFVGTHSRDETSASFKRADFTRANREQCLAMRRRNATASGSTLSLGGEGTRQKVAHSATTGALGEALGQPQEKNVDEAHHGAIAITGEPHLFNESSSFQVTPLKRTRLDSVNFPAAKLKCETKLSQKFDSAIENPTKQGTTFEHSELANTKSSAQLLLPPACCSSC